MYQQAVTGKIGIGVAVGGGVRLGVTDAVMLGVKVAVAVGGTVWVAVAVWLGVNVNVAVWVALAVSVGVAEGNAVDVIGIDSEGGASFTGSEQPSIPGGHGLDSGVSCARTLITPCMAKIPSRKANRIKPTLFVFC